MRSRDRVIVIRDDRNRYRHDQVCTALRRRGFTLDDGVGLLDFGWVRYYSGRPIYAAGVEGFQLEWRVMNRPEGGVRVITKLKSWINA